MVLCICKPGERREENQGLSSFPKNELGERKPGSEQSTNGLIRQNKAHSSWRELVAAKGWWGLRQTDLQ